MGFKFCLLVLFIAVSFISAQSTDTWQKVIKQVEHNLVSIEYYEEMNSSGSINNGNKVKRTVNGVVVDSSGLIMTSASIYKATLGFSGGPLFGSSVLPADISVRFLSGDIFDASFVGKDDDKNVAFIKIDEPIKTRGLRFYQALDIEIGQEIFLVYQLDEKYNFQIMLLNKTINSILEGPPKKILSEAQIANDKFGIACDLKGTPIGIFSEQEMRYSFDYDRVVPAFMEILLAESFIGLIKNPPKYEKKNTSRKNWLGVNIQPFTRELAKYFRNVAIHGILINTVLEDSPAEKAGIKIGDVITEYNGIKVAAENNSDMEVFRSAVREFNGVVSSIKIWRNGKISDLKVEMAEVPISQYLADEVSNQVLGFSAKELTKDIILAKQLSFDVNGVWISRVERAGWADLSGLNVGDLLLKVDNKDLQDIEQLNKYLHEFEKDKPKYISFFIKRRSETRFLFIKTNFN